MQIVPAHESHLDAITELFIARVEALRRDIPLVPDTLAQPEAVADRLRGLIADAPAWIALEGEVVVGYLAGWIVPDFRSAGRTTAYCPEWGHATAPGREAGVYRALYHTASRTWHDMGCEAHALTLLARQPATEHTWFWSGFGGLVVDAVRGMTRLSTEPPSSDVTVRRAGKADLDALVALEAEHARHYAEPPTLMCAYHGKDRDALETLLAASEERYWLALDGEEPAAFVCFGQEHGGADLLAGPSTASIHGAYTRPAYRGQRLMPALIDAALATFAEEGVQRCTVDFECVNGAAAAFWPRYFEPVCLSVMRIPERGPEPA